MDMEELEANTSQETKVLFGEELGQGDLGTIEQVKEEMSIGRGETQQTPTSSSSGWLGFLTLDYYQGFFDVTTLQEKEGRVTSCTMSCTSISILAQPIRFDLIVQCKSPDPLSPEIEGCGLRDRSSSTGLLVLERIAAGMVPWCGFSLIDKVSLSPDLYGPFWLAMTLTLTVAISSNLSRLFHDAQQWEFHFHEVTLIGTAIYGYTWLVPCLLWALLWWRGNRLRYTLMQLIAVYGYSISIFIPLMLLWLINNELIRWLLLAVAILLSGGVLLTALWRPLKAESVKLAVGVLLVMLLLHTGLCVGFKFFYFSSLMSVTSGPLASNSTFSHS